MCIISSYYFQLSTNIIYKLVIKNSANDSIRILMDQRTIGLTTISSCRISGRSGLDRWRIEPDVGCKSFNQSSFFVGSWLTVWQGFCSGVRISERMAPARGSGEGSHDRDPLRPGTGCEVNAGWAGRLLRERERECAVLVAPTHTATHGHTTPPPAPPGIYTDQHRPYRYIHNQLLVLPFLSLFSPEKEPYVRAGKDFQS